MRTYAILIIILIQSTIFWNWVVLRNSDGKMLTYAFLVGKAYGCEIPVGYVFFRNILTCHDICMTAKNKWVFRSSAFLLFLFLIYFATDSQDLFSIVFLLMRYNSFISIMLFSPWYVLGLIALLWIEGVNNEKPQKCKTKTQV